MAESSCASEGTVEVLIEPQLPQPLLAVVGDSPAAVTLRDLAAAIGWSVTSDLARGRRGGRRRDDGTRRRRGARRGARDSGRLRRASSRARSARASSSRACASEGSTRRRSRASGARPASTSARSTQPEIAVAVLAELVAWRARPRPRSASRRSRRSIPVCGMTVAVAPDTPSAEHEGVDLLVLLPRAAASRFARDPARFLATQSA